MIVHLLTTALLQFVWQGALAAASLWVALVVLRSRSANARYVVSCATLAVLAAAPFVSAALAYRRPMPAHQAPAIAVAVAREAVLRVAALPSTDWMALAQAWILSLWACGVFVFSLRLLWSYREVSALRRSGAPAEDSVIETVSRLAAKLGVERPVHVMLSSLAGSPSVVGWMRPVILLPVGTLFGLTPEQLEAVIAHELAHIRRCDYLVNVVQMLVETLFFYHPAVWWISRRIRVERELCCDDIAVASCGDAVSYARALTMLERIRLHPSFAVGADDGPLMYRVQRLLGVAPREFAPSRISALAAISIAVVCFGINLRLAHAQAPPPPVHDQPGITVDLHGANVTERQAVSYPPAARTKGSQGNVVVEVTLDENGNVSDAKVLGGPQEFRKTVLQSVLSWHFAAEGRTTVRRVSVAFQPEGAAGLSLASDEQIRARQRRALQLADRNAGSMAVVQTLAFMQDQEESAEEELERGIKTNEDLQPLVAKLDNVRAKAAIARDAAALVLLGDQSRKIAAIEVRGAPESLSETLRAQLPVRQGDMLTGESWQAVDEVVKQIDRRLQTSISPQPDGSCILRIILVGGVQ